MNDLDRVSDEALKEWVRCDSKGEVGRMARELLVWRSHGLTPEQVGQIVEAWRKFGGQHRHDCGLNGQTGEMHEDVCTCGYSDLPAFLREGANDD